MAFEETCIELLRMNNTDDSNGFINRKSKVLYSNSSVQWILLEATTTMPITKTWKLATDYMANQCNNETNFLKFRKKDENTIITVFTACNWGGMVFEFPTHTFTLPKNTSDSKTGNLKYYTLFKCEKIRL